jgi:hypothetical protein
LSTQIEELDLLLNTELDLSGGAEPGILSFLLIYKYNKADPSNTFFVIIYTFDSTR